MSGSAATRLALLLLIAAGVLTTSATAIWYATQDPHHNLVESELAPQWWTQGKCRECHSADGAQGSKAPAYHSAQFRQFTHGRSELKEDRCLKCHNVQGCRDCHALAPQNHTADFRKPGSDTDEASRHPLLARLRPSACLTCHGNFNVSCGRCHNRAESDAWTEEARKTQHRWPKLTGKAERP